MYKDKEKQKEANRLRQQRFKAKKAQRPESGQKQGIGNVPVTPTINEQSNALPITPSGNASKVTPKDNAFDLRPVYIEGIN